MHFESASRSVIRSVRQGDLFNAWLRVYRRERAMPLIHQFDYERLFEEKPDLMFYDVVRNGGGYRYLVQHHGRNLMKAFAVENTEGRHLDEYLDAERLGFMASAFIACIEARRPVFTVSAVRDVNGVPVSYERLALPFGANDRVQQLIVSLKTISVEGRFETRELMRAEKQRYSYELCAVIDRDLDGAQNRMAATNDVVEI
jgi:hypothetical protein